MAFRFEGPSATPTIQVDPSIQERMDTAAKQSALQNRAAGPSTREGTSRDTKYQVYLGSKSVRDVGGGAGSANAAENRAANPGRKLKADNVTTIDEAIASWYDMSDEERSSWAKQAFALGYISDPSDLENAEQSWQWAVQKSSNFYMSKAQRKVTPKQVLAMYAGGNASGRAKSLAGQTVTQKNRIVDVSNPTEARAIIEAAFQQSVGRDPTDSELRTLTRSLTAEQRSNPEIQTSTVKYDANGNPMQTTNESTGGIDPEQFVNGNVQNDPEAAAYQGATSYFPALLQALGSPL